MADSEKELARRVRVAQRAKAKARLLKAQARGIERPPGLTERLKATKVKGLGGQALSPKRPSNQIVNQVQTLNRDLRGVGNKDLNTKAGRNKIRKMLKAIPKIQKLAQQVPDDIAFKMSRKGAPPRKPGEKVRRAGTRGNILGQPRTAGAGARKGTRILTGRNLKTQASALSKIGSKLANFIKKFEKIDKAASRVGIVAPKVDPVGLRQRMFRKEAEKQKL